MPTPTTLPSSVTVIIYNAHRTYLTTAVTVAGPPAFYLCAIAQARADGMNPKLLNPKARSPNILYKP